MTFLRWMLLTVLLIAGAVLYRSSLDGFFLADDFGNIHLYSRTSLSAFSRLFANDWSQGIWGYNLQELRPLTGLMYWLDARTWGTNSFGYHLENLLLYLLITAGLYFLIMETARGLPSRTDLPDIAVIGTAALGAMLFLVHPAHVEAVAWVSGRTDLLAAVTYIWAMALLARYWRDSRVVYAITGVLIFAAGLFMKENVSTLPACFLIYVLLAGGLKGRRKQLLVVMTPLILLALMWTGLRLVAFQSIGRGANFTGFRGFIARLPYYSGQTLPNFGAAITYVVAAGFVLCVGYGFYRWDSGGRMVVFWGLGWTAVTLPPLIAVTYDSPRHLFLALAGPLTALSATAGMWRRSRPAVPLAAAALCLLLSVRFARHTANWLPVWKESAAYSRQLFELLSAGKYRADDVVVVNSGPPVQIFFWQWALPFAVERPFMDFPARIVAGPDWYCCAEWQARREAVLKEVAAGAAARVHRIDFNPSTHKFEEH